MYIYIYIYIYISIMHLSTYTFHTGRQGLRAVRRAPSSPGPGGLVGLQSDLAGKRSIYYDYYCC